jgi:hypothetical protein
MRTVIFALVAGTLIAASVFAEQHFRQMSMPDLDGAIGWLNSTPLSRESLRGNVVLVDFWTYTCINSLRPLRPRLGGRIQKRRFSCYRRSYP